MTDHPFPGAPSGDLVRRFADAIDRQDWAGLGALLAPDLVGTWVHTGEVFDAERFVAYNRLYPGSWRFTVEDVVDVDDRAVLRARVSDGTDTFYVACFARFSHQQMVELTEVWTDAVRPTTDRSS